MGSLIGSEVPQAYPGTTRGLSLSDVTNRSTAQVSALADTCGSQAGLDLADRPEARPSSLLTTDPVTVPSWSRAIADNIPAPPRIPTLLIQGLDDPVILPGSNAT